MKQELDQLLARHQRDLAELLSLVGVGNELNPRVEELVERCSAHVTQLMQALEAQGARPELPDETKQSLAQLMQLQAMAGDAVEQERCRLAREIQQAQQLRTHLQNSLPQEPDGGSCDMRG